MTVGAKPFEDATIGKNDGKMRVTSIVFILIQINIALKQKSVYRMASLVFHLIPISVGFETEISIQTVFCLALAKQL